MSDLCGVCNNLCSGDGNDIRCSGSCAKWFHSKCTKDDLEGKKTRSRKEWRCKDCRIPSSVNSSANSSSSGTTLTKEFLVRVLEDFKKEVFNELKNFKAEMAEITNSLQFFSDKIDESNTLMGKIGVELAELKVENEVLRGKVGSQEHEMCELRERVRSLEQYTRKNNVEISGIPETPQENVFGIVKDLGKSLGLEVQERDVAAAHRVPAYKRDRIPSIIVQFHSKGLKDQWTMKYRERKNITAKEVNSSFPASRLFINDHLSPDNKLFLSKLKQKCKEVGYKYAWCRDGKFFVRKADGDRCLRINNQDDLCKIK